MHAGTEPIVLLDGVRCEGQIIDGESGELLYPLAGETLDPGEHSIEVRIGDVVHRANVYSQEPMSPALPRPRQKKHVRDHIVRFSLERSADPQVLMINEKSEVFEIRPSLEIRYWLRILGEKDQEITDFESYFDSSWLDWIHPLPGQRAETLLFAVREASDRPWKILKRKGSLRALERSSRFESMDEAMKLVQLFEEPEEILELFNFSGSGVQVRIGREIGHPQFEQYSIIKTEYRYSANEQGTIGLIGPIRMDYSKAMYLLETVQATISQLFSGIHL